MVMKQEGAFLASFILLFFNCKTKISKVQELNPKVVNTINQVVNENNLPGLTFSIIQKNGQIEIYGCQYKYE